MHRRKTDKEKPKTKKYPRGGEDVYGWLETEHGVPDGRGSEKHASQDIELDVILPISTAQQCDLEAGSTEHLSQGDDDRVQWPPVDFS